MLHGGAPVVDGRVLKTVPVVRLAVEGLARSAGGCAHSDQLPREDTHACAHLPAADLDCPADAHREPDCDRQDRRHRRADQRARGHIHSSASFGNGRGPGYWHSDASPDPDEATLSDTFDQALA